MLRTLSEVVPLWLTRTPVFSLIMQPSETIKLTIPQKLFDARIHEVLPCSCLRDSKANFWSLIGKAPSSSLPCPEDFSLLIIPVVQCLLPPLWLASISIYEGLECTFWQKFSVNMELTFCVFLLKDYSLVLCPVSIWKYLLPVVQLFMAGNLVWYSSLWCIRNWKSLCFSRFRPYRMLLHQLVNFAVFSNLFEQAVSSHIILKLGKWKFLPSIPYTCSVSSFLFRWHLDGPLI